MIDRFPSNGWGESLSGPLGWRETRSKLAEVFPVLFVFFVAFLFRSQQFGNPDVDLDEQFYLLVADRMLQGSLVYVDIWDRKPIGLFLIFAIARLMGGNGVIQYQIVATLFVCATCYFMWRIGQRYVDKWKAIFPPLLYIFWLDLYLGSAGQVAVFFNLFMIVAVWATIKINNNNTDLTKSKRTGSMVMIVLGLAIQIKYTVIPEGIYIGCYILLCLHRQGAYPIQIIRSAAYFCFLALLPTLLVGSYYVAAGHFSEFYFANFISIFKRGALTEEFTRQSLTMILTSAIPLIIASLGGLFVILRRQGNEKSDCFFLIGWLISAAVGFSMIGNFYTHYFVSLLLPLCLLTAPLFQNSLIALPLFAAISIYPLKLAGQPTFKRAHSKAIAIHQMTDVIRHHLNGRCLFVFDGPSVLYLTSNACIPTRFAYPDHLSNDVEKTGLGADTVAEMRRVLASDPGVIVYAQRPVIPKMNVVNVALVNAAISRKYVKIASIVNPERVFDVYALKQ